MADTDGAEAEQDLEAPDEEEEEEEEQAFLHFGAYSDARHALPWEQWSFREKANYCMDRAFLCVLLVFFLIILGEFGFKMWQATKGTKTVKAVSESVALALDWLFTQEPRDQLAEL